MGIASLPLVLALPTEDRRRAHDFYVDALGLTPFGEPEADGLPEPLQLVVNDGLRLMLIPTEGFGWTVAGRPVASVGTHECQLVLNVDSPNEVDGLIEQVRRAGADIVREPEQLPWGYVANFSDPDGHLWLALSDGDRRRS